MTRLALIVAVGVCSSVAGAQCIDIGANESHHSQPELSDLLGDSIAIDGLVAIAGMPHNNDQGWRAGKVAFFEFTDDDIWEYAGNLTATDAEPEAYFGQSVAISGGFAIVGAPNKDVDTYDNGGKAYILRLDGGWSELQDLASPDPEQDGWFGNAVAISGNVAVVGAPFDDEVSANAGKVHVYRRGPGDVWNEEPDSPLLPSANPFQANFGRAVAIDGNVIVVGSPGSIQDQGRAYVYRYGGGSWVEEQILGAPDGEDDDAFGWSVAVSDNVAVIGARGDDDLGNGAGAAYVYRFNDPLWALEAKLLGCEAGDGSFLGDAVSVHGDLIVAGAPLGGAGRAHAYRFIGAHWAHVARLVDVDPNPDDFDFFGDAVGVSGDMAVVGAPGWDIEPGYSEGALFGFRYLDTLEASCPGDVNSDGIADVVDFLSMLAVWGPCPAPCAQDLDGDGTVSITDFLSLLANWGLCHVVVP